MIKWINKKRNKKGFTLVELVVVIAILGVLAAIAVPRLTTSRTSAANSAHNANVRTLEGAANMYMADKGVPTGNSVTWEADGGVVGVLETHNWAPYIQKWPSIPKGGTTADTGKYKVVIAKDTGTITVTPEAVDLK